MSEQPDQQSAVDRAQLRESLATITAQLASLGEQVAAIARAADIGGDAIGTGSEPAGHVAPAARDDSLLHEGSPATHTGPAARGDATADEAVAEYDGRPSPYGGEPVLPASAPSGSLSPAMAQPMPTAPQEPSGPPPPAVAPPPPVAADMPIPVATLPPAPTGAWPAPPGAVIPGAVPAPAPGAWPAPAAPAVQPKAPSAWADTSGLKALGWVGGAVTVLGVVMLLVVAIQQRLLTAEARVGIGAVLAIVLVVGGYLLRRKESQAAVAATVVCTGLAVGFLTIVGATRLDSPLVVAVAQALSVVVVAIAVVIAVRWSENWLAGAAFAASALLAPVVASGVGIGVYVFEAILIAGAAAALLFGLGMVVWACTALSASFILVVAMATDVLSPAGLLALIVIALITWALFYGRWLTGRAPRDPGLFAIRPRSFDPAQIARDYADFHVHQARANAARADAAAAGLSLGIGGGFLVLGFALVDRPAYLDNGVGAGAAVFAVLFGVLAWASGRIPAIDHTAARLIAWSTAVALAAVALLRFLGGDARAVAWLVLAIAVFIVVGLERISLLVLPAIVLGLIALIGSAPALSPRAVTFWPSGGILASGGGLLPRAWQAVFPAGLCVLALCLAAWWAVSRCSAAEVDAARQASRQVASGVRPDGAELATRDLAAAESWHTAVMAWTIVCCSLVACYGLLVVTMVLAYAISPTRAGFQAGQIVVTLLVTLVALVLLWQGFRRFILRIGGLCIALVAVAKLLLVDTGTLEALPRSLTVIGVGVLLLLAAVAYVMALSRMGAEQEPGAPRS